MHLFYCPDISGNTIALPEEEAHHIFHVLRLRENAVVNITDGKGKMLTARLTEISKKNVFAEVTTETILNPRAGSLHIAIAPTKNIDRFEWFLEKATEIGIEKVTPLLCQRSERKEIKPERLEKLVIAAAKQSQRAHFPQLEKMISFSGFIKSEIHGQKLIAHCLEEDKLTLNALKKSSATILIGPEGDFSSDEIEMAKQEGFSSLSLGESRLRTETAALVACVGFSLFAFT